MMKINREKLGIYLHIPFCESKCVYCAFLSEANASVNTRKDYVDSLINEIKIKGAPYSDRCVDTIFIGGGTPSLLDSNDIKALLNSIRTQFVVDTAAEITIEANPGTLDLEKLTAYKAMGINRISMGVQSLDNGLLERLGRIHRSEDVKKNIKDARLAGFDNINIDLMFAIPNHTIEKWERTLNEAIELNPEHISFYSLQLEEGTTLYKQYMNGELEYVSDDIDRKMYHVAIEVLEKNGYEHYEISNAAKKGKRCRHNIKYWSMENYLGFGVGAHSFVDGKRFANIEDIKLYINENGIVNYESIYQNNLRDSAAEFMFTGLRKCEGISLKLFEKLFGKALMEFYEEEKEEILKYIEDGFLLIETDYLRLTKKGIDISNSIMATFV